MAAINFNEIPSSDFKVEPGRYNLVCIDAKLVTTPNGFKAIETTWESLEGTKFKVNFDRCIYGTTEKDFDFEQKAVAFGCAKLKKINEATLNKESLDPAIFVRLLVGQKINALLKLTEKGYPEIDGTNIEAVVTATTPAPEAPTTFTMPVDAADDPFKL